MIKTNFEAEGEQGNNYEFVEVANENINSQEKSLFSLIEEYMEGELKTKFGEKEDVSYEWITKDSNIQFLNKCIKSDLGNLKTMIDKRDTACELKVI
jgi:hypothetical protein